MIIELKDLPKDRVVQKINFEIIFDSSGEIKEINSNAIKVPEIPEIKELKSSAPKKQEIQETQEVSSNALGVDTNRPPKVDDDIMNMEF